MARSLFERLVLEKTLTALAGGDMRTISDVVLENSERALQPVERGEGIPDSVWEEYQVIKARMVVPTKNVCASIAEAAQLILQAGAMGEGREIFILKMGEPARILDLARDVIRFSGLEPEKDIEIVFTGLRPGEKLYEELITEGEGIVPTRHEKIMVLTPDQCDNHDRLGKQVDELIRVADTFDIPAIKAKLKEIVPEYTPQ